MFLITSAAYLDQEFAAEFGRLPPAFLPVGNRLLLRHQLEQISAYDGSVRVSLPDDFELNEFERAQLDSAGCQVVRVPTGLSLGESVLYSLNVTGYHTGPLRILHGDTLMYDLPLERVDVLAVGQIVDNYQWDAWTISPQGDARGGHDEPDLATIAGYFAFADTAEYIRRLVEVRSDFVASLEAYRQARALEAINVPRWFDFGHLKTYYRSKSHVTTERSFNELSVTPRVVRKRSEQRGKVSAEAAWFSTIPGALRVFTPQLVDVESRGYATEYLYLSTLGELYVFGRLPVFVWHRIFGTCRDFLQQANEHRPDVSPCSDHRDAYRNKTMERLNDFASESGFDLDRPISVNGRQPVSLREVADTVSALQRPATLSDVCVVHGDFCFSNILYDFRVEAIKVIDPRGLTMAGEPSIFGDRRYDLAKLYHSVVGRYDHIVAGYVDCERHGDEMTLRFPKDRYLHEIEDCFRVLLLDSDRELELDIAAITIQLFLSMLPLHNDRPDRQQAFAANAIRLFGDLLEMKARTQPCRETAL